MEQSLSWEVNRSSASQEIPHILWDTKVQYRIHNSSPPVPNVSHVDPVYAPTIQILYIFITKQLLLEISFKMSKYFWYKPTVCETDINA